MEKNHNFPKIGRLTKVLLLLTLLSMPAVLLIEEESGWQVELVILGMSVLIFISS